ncbi:MAG: TIGR03435 family protein [Bryobacteraceae bacterium]
MIRFAAIFLASFAYAQTPAALQFEVAAIKPASPEEIQAGSSGCYTGHGRARCTDVTLKRCIVGAYHAGPGQIVGGPSWIDSDRFHIEAKAAEAVGDDAELDAMMKALLAERFHLTLHRETRNLQALVLEAAKNGPKLEKAPGGEAVTDSSQGLLTLKNTTMDGLAERLARVTELPVVNHTAIDGVFNMKLVWTPEGENPKGPGSPPSLFTAIQEQLGLRLQSQKTQVEVLVVDHAERPDAN